MYPREKTHARDGAKQCPILIPTQDNRENESEYECEIVGWCNSKETLREKFWHFWCCKTSNSGSPKRERVRNCRKYEKNTDRYRPHLDELIQIPIPLRKSGYWSVLIEMIDEYAQACECSESIESLKWMYLGHETIFVRDWEILYLV